MLNLLSNYSGIVLSVLVSVGLFCIIMAWGYYLVKSVDMLPEKVLEKKTVKAKLVDILEYKGLYINYETKKEEVMTLYKLIFEFELDGEIHRAETPKAWTQEYKDTLVEMQEEGVFTDEIFVTISLKDYSIMYPTPPYKFNKERNNSYYQDFKKNKVRKYLLDKGFHKKQIDSIDIDFYDNVENYITMVYFLSSLFGALCLTWFIGFIRICFIVFSYLMII